MTDVATAAASPARLRAMARRFLAAIDEPWHLDATNTIPGAVRLLATIRWLDEAEREDLLLLAEEIAQEGRHPC